jgi:hypothetical protein
LGDGSVSERQRQTKAEGGNVRLTYLVAHVCASIKWYLVVPVARIRVHVLKRESLLPVILEGKLKAIVVYVETITKIYAPSELKLPSHRHARGRMVQ